MRKSTMLIVPGICLVLCQGLFPPIAWIVCNYMPHEYTSRVTIEVKSDAIPLPVDGTDNSGGAINPYVPGGADPAQILQSTGILYPVIDQMGLADKWSAGPGSSFKKEDAYRKLVKMIKVSRKLDNALSFTDATSRMFIDVTSADRQEAADIANTIALVYLKKWREDQDKGNATESAQLNAEVEKQRPAVDQAKAELEKVRDRYNVQDPNRENMNAQPVTPDVPEYKAAKQKYIDARNILDAVDEKSSTTKKELQTMPLPARILDNAEPAESPSSPNIPHILMAASGLGFLCAMAGIALILLGLRVKRHEAAPPI
jgi:uncharacterized protein involved in exopolysaccharide biosynthesis